MKIENMIYHKVKNIYLNENPDRNAHPYATGLVIELEDGTCFRHQSTDIVMPFEKMPGKMI